MKSKTVENRKILRRAFCSLCKLQAVKRGKVLRVKFSARNEKQNCQSAENLSFARLVWLPITGIYHQIYTTFLNFTYSQPIYLIDSNYSSIFGFSNNNRCSRLLFHNANTIHINSSVCSTGNFD